jgi:hypothetical protein
VFIPYTLLAGFMCLCRTYGQDYETYRQYYETLSHVVILSKHHHHYHQGGSMGSTVPPIGGLYDHEY